MEVIKIFLFIILICFAGILIRSYKYEYFLLFEISAVTGVGFIIISSADNLLNGLEELSYLSSDVSPYLKILLKALCISILTDFASSFCIDSSNQTLSKAVELIGKTAILSLSLPMLKKFIENVIEFLG